MSSSEVIAVAAVFISLLSVGAAFLTFRISVSAERRARMPALVISRAGSELIVANVGAGPALNVVYAQGRRPIVLGEGVNEPWFNPIHLEPIGPGAKRQVAWEDESADHGLRYTDAFGYQYVVKASQFGTTILERRHGRSALPDWKLGKDDVPYLSELGERKPSDRWEERTR
jgi:hypothetical protein